MTLLREAHYIFRGLLDALGLLHWDYGSLGLMIRPSMRHATTTCIYMHEMVRIRRRL